METVFPHQRQLREQLTKRIERNPRYSLRAFAAVLEMDPGAFCQILSGKRFPSEKLAERIFERLDFSPNEKLEFLRSLALAKSKGGLKRISPALRKHLLVSPMDEAKKELTTEIFKTIADWYHFAILELPYVRGFKSDPRWIARALGISTSEAHSGIQRLIDLGLLEKKGRKLCRVNAQLKTADRELTTAAHKRRQKQVLLKSIDSLENDSIEIRNQTAMTFAINSKKLPEAKAKIERFISEMTELLEAGARDQVYEMTVNLFPLQKIRTINKQGQVK